jgi:hypothetical protein
MISKILILFIVFLFFFIIFRNFRPYLANVRIVTGLCHIKAKSIAGLTVIQLLSSINSGKSLRLTAPAILASISTLRRNDRHGEKMAAHLCNALAVNQMSSFHFKDSAAIVCFFTSEMPVSIIHALMDFELTSILPSHSEKIVFHPTTLDFQFSSCTI